MRICISSWAPFLAGAEVAAERLALGLQAAGHDVSVVLGTRGGALTRLEQAGLTCHYVPMVMTDKWSAWRYFKMTRSLARLFAALAPDVVHANDLPTSQMVGRAARKLRIPLVCHHRWIFDGPAVDWLNKYGADRHLFVSQALMDDLCAKSDKLASSSREVVYDGLELPLSPREQDRSEAKRQLGLPEDQLIVLFAGQIIERKGVADLLQAWSILAPRWDAYAKLVIVGEDLESRGNYRRKMETLANQLAPAARFMGFQKNVPQWLTAADVVLVPSHAEPLGNATLEAMAHQRSVIGTTVGGIPEMIQNEVTGLLVPPKSPQELATAIDRLLANPGLRERTGIAARQRCQEVFDIQVHVSNVLRQYDLVISGKSAEALT